MYLFESEEKTREVKIACDENDCDGEFTHKSDLSDCSPRVEGECPKCKRYINVKLSSVDEKRIISREIN